MPAFTVYTGLVAHILHFKIIYAKYNKMTNLCSKGGQCVRLIIIIIITIKRSLNNKRS